LQADNAPGTLAAGLTYRRDRFGECWHIVPPGALGLRGRTACGEPRQGTRLSETYADTRPEPPDCICARCSALIDGQTS
jgi:hypothetical protein